ncbi:unnamed protein product, partial [Clonostachys byssicola]
MLTPSSGHCLQKVAYVLRSMYGFCTKMSDLSGGNPRSRRRACVKRTFSPVLVEAGSTRMADSGTPRWRARRAKMTASGSSKRLAVRAPEPPEMMSRGARPARKRSAARMATRVSRLQRQKMASAAVGVWERRW